MSSRSCRRFLAAGLLAGFCLLSMPLRAEATAVDVGGVFAPAIELWGRVVNWWQHITGVPQPPKFGAGQSSDGRAAKSARIVPTQAL